MLGSELQGANRQSVDVQGYKTRKQAFEIGQFKGSLRVLKDKTQYADDSGEAERAGICSASWSLFGVLWPASKVLATKIKYMELNNQRILELGCGLGLPSLTLQYRKADITASDYHPVSQDFLDYNARLNQLPTIPFLQLDWNNPHGPQQEYDLIIASDLLYGPGHPELLMQTIEYLAKPHAKVLFSCPGRGYKNLFSRKMSAMGFELEETPVAFDDDELAPYKGRLLTYRR